MKQSELRNIIKEEIGKALSENAEMDKMNQTFNNKVGVKSANPSVKNTMKKKEFKVEFQQYINDDYDVDFITVKAEDEADALIKAKEQLKQSGKRNIRYDKLKVIG
jgi:uncharacterized protein (DUF305 family)